MTARIILALIIGLAFVSAGSAVDLAGGKRKNQPIQIKSNSLSTDSGKRSAVFTGKVVARQGDVVIYCDKLVIYYSEKDKDVDKVEAFGDVRIIQGDKTAQSGHAIYDSKGGKIVLDDNPKMYQGENEVSGKVIIYYFETQRSEVTSDPDKRVTVVIHPKQKDKDGSASP